MASSANVQSEEAKQELLNRIHAEAKQQRNVEVSTNDHIVIMTTCNLGETNGRYTLVGKLLDHEVANPFPEEEKEVRLGDRLNLFSIFDRFLYLSVWQWIAILVALIVLTWTLYRLELRRVRRKKAANEELIDRP